MAQIHPPARPWKTIIAIPRKPWLKTEFSLWQNRMVRLEVALPRMVGLLFVRLRKSVIAPLVTVERSLLSKVLFLLTVVAKCLSAEIPLKTKMELTSGESLALRGLQTVADQLVMPLIGKRRGKRNLDIVRTKIAAEQTLGVTHIPPAANYRTMIVDLHAEITYTANGGIGMIATLAT